MEAKRRIYKMAANFRFLPMIAILLSLTGSVTAQADPTPDPVELCSAWIEARAWTAHASNPETHLISDRVACYDGMIDRGSFDELDAWLEEATTPLTLVIRSGGGDASVALSLAEKLQAKRARVYVKDICASSCANFIYAGVRDRYVRDGALVLFHGGFSRETRARAMASMETLLAGPQGALIEDHDASLQSARESYDAAMARQDALYRRIDVDSTIVHGVDAIDFTAIDNLRCGGASELPRNFVYFDRLQMDRLGIAPVAGRPETTPKRVNAAIATLGRSFVACLAPPDILEMDQL